MRRSAATGDSVGPGLLQNSAYYEHIVALIAALGPETDPEIVLSLIELAAHCATHYHTGRLSDGALENIALEIGAQLDRHVATAPAPEGPSASKAAGRRTIVHVATTVSAIGGHTRTIACWIRNDPDSHHTVVLTQQAKGSVPEVLARAVADAHSDLVVWSADVPRMTRARWLRDVSRGRDLVVLHHHSEDVIPTVAFAVPGLPPVTVLNHADHIFWLGSTVTDTLIDLRECGRDLAGPRRAMRARVVLPLPLDDIPQFDRTAARRALGVPDDRVVLLSVGRGSKYAPNGRHDFFATAQRILEARPHAELFLVGAHADPRLAGLDPSIRSRFHCTGPVDDARPYQRAADVYLEGFPFGSQTACLEAALHGVPTVLAYAPLSPLLATHDLALTDFVENPSTEGEYIRAVTTFIDNVSLRTQAGAQLAQSVRRYHVGADWRQRLETIYAQTMAGPHRPGPILTMRPVADTHDLALDAWQSNGRRPGRLRATIGEELFDAAYRLRNRGQLRGAWQLLRASAAVRGWSFQNATAAAKLLPYFATRRFAPVGSTS